MSIERIQLFTYIVIVISVEYFQPIQELREVYTYYKMALIKKNSNFKYKI